MVTLNSYMFQVRHSKLSLRLPDPEDGSTMLLQDVGNCLPVRVLYYPKSCEFSWLNVM